MIEHWSRNIAREVASKFPKEETYTCASGISPSGVVHAGNFRDIITSDAVYRSLISLGKPARLLFSWDDFDRFRKVPAGISEDFLQHIGKPLSNVPDPKGELPSYAKRYELEFEESLKKVGINPIIKYQSQEYKSGRYDSMIKYCLNHRKEIARIFAQFKTQGMSEQDIESYFPVSVYSRFTGKDNTKVLSFEGESKLTYLCKDTNKRDTFDLCEDRIAKLVWRVDWPMRWQIENVNFEPGGRDHSSVGGSYEMGQVIAKKVFNGHSPLFKGYDFIGVRGMPGKMSGSLGNVVDIEELLKIYDPTILRWMYLRYSPEQAFDFSFDSDVFRIYSEFDKEVMSVQDGSANESVKECLELSKQFSDTNFLRNPISFRQIAGHGQVVQFNREKLEELLQETGERYDAESISQRLPRAKNWLELYNPEKMVRLIPSPNLEYFSQLNSESRAHIKKLEQFLIEHPKASVLELEQEVYAIPKLPNISDEEKKKRQREFFKQVYTLLIGKDTGPRLSTFLWAIDKSKTCRLLSEEI